MTKITKIAYPTPAEQRIYKLESQLQAAQAERDEWRELAEIRLAHIVPLQDERDALREALTWLQAHLERPGDLHDKQRLRALEEVDEALRASTPSEGDE